MIESTPPVPRRHDMDALRVFACYLLIPFHVGMVFNPAPFYHVRNDEVSFALLVFCGFVSLWHMPLLFLLAGWSMAASLRRRGVAAFLAERWHKLAVPLVAGCVLLAPGIKFLELRSGLDLNHRGLRVSPELQDSFRDLLPVELPLAPAFEEDFLEFLPSFFTQLDRFSWSHLWFLAYLLTLSLILLPPLAAWMRRTRGSGARSRLWLYAPLLPLLAIQLTLRERFPGPYNLYEDWASVSYYATYLMAGFALALSPGLEVGLRAERGRLLALGLASAGVLLLGALGFVTTATPLLVGSGVAGWCFVLALLGFAQGRVTRRGRRFGYLVESAFPVYWLHQPVVVALGFWIVTLPLGLAPKLVLLLLGSLALTQGLYHAVLRPFGPLRRLVGQAGRSDRSAAVASPVGAAAALEGR